MDLGGINQVRKGLFERNTVSFCAIAFNTFVYNIIDDVLDAIAQNDTIFFLGLRIFLPTCCHNYGLLSGAERQNPRAPSEGFLSSAFKHCSKLYGVLLKLRRFILGCAL